MLARLANDPIDRIDPAEPIDPMDSTEPTDPIDSTEPTELIESTEPRDPIDSTDAPPPARFALIPIRHTIGLRHPRFTRRAALLYRVEFRVVNEPRRQRA